MWYGLRGARVGQCVSTLPNPKFRMHDFEHVSFSTNNYLGIASCARMKAAAIAGIEAYGVGNCESRLLSGNLQIYNELEETLAHSKGQTRALLFATVWPTSVRCRRCRVQLPLRGRLGSHRLGTIRMRTSATSTTTSAFARVSRLPVRRVRPIGIST